VSRWDPGVRLVTSAACAPHGRPSVTPRAPSVAGNRGLTCQSLSTSSRYLMGPCGQNRLLPLLRASDSVCGRRQSRNSLKQTPPSGRSLGGINTGLPFSLSLSINLYPTVAGAWCWAPESADAVERPHRRAVIPGLFGGQGGCNIPKSIPKV
jgi:hypothetical protein